MDTATKPQPGRATDRVLEALSSLGAVVDRTINEVKALDADFQGRLLQSIKETETSLQAQAALHLEEALNESRSKLEEHFGNRVTELSNQWEEERKRLNAELGKLTEKTAHWEAERTRLQSELQRLAKLQAATQAEAENAIMAVRAATAASKTARSSLNTQALNTEIDRVQGIVKTISDLIEDPAVELSTVIRKNVERAELEAYLKGIRYALNGVESK
jgi:chromosome segregation ATPase